MMTIKMRGAIVACILLVGCSDPKNYKLPEKIGTTTEILELKKQAEKLSSEDKALLAGFVTRSLIPAALGESVESVSTIGEAIIAQKMWFHEQAAEIAAQQNIKNEEINKKANVLSTMNSALTTSLISKQLMSKDYERQIYSDFFLVSLLVKNNGVDDISGFSGYAILKDSLGNHIKTIEVSTSTTIISGSSIIYPVEFSYNQFKDTEVKLANSNIETLKYEWIPGTYIYANGKKLSSPN